MNIERLLKDAAAAETRGVTRESLPPLSLPAARRRPARRWTAPVAAVLAMVAVAAVSVGLRGVLRGPDALGAHEGPPYFLATQRKGGAGVFDSWTGRKIADIRPDAGHYTALAVSADRRTAFLAAETGSCRTHIEKATLRRDGTVASRTTLPGEFGPPADEMAATADGGRVALTFDNTTGCVGDDLAVVESASGTTRGWRVSPGGADTLSSAQSPVWAADGRALFLAENVPAGPGEDYTGPDLSELDTRTAGAGPLRARPVLRGITDLSSLRPSPDGRTVTAIKKNFGADSALSSIAILELTLSRGGSEETSSVRELARMTARQIAPAPSAGFQTTLDATGRHLLVSSGHDRAVFRMDDGRVRRLPDVHRDLDLIAW
ncbi:hypothetical protein [Actinomadura sp. NEAU-AAG7]|uniref:hypothetical protein n=1 Tax=Actinomadura sp. NEAU-AAG7 TaxID=2839640 RepID=UPI001BE4D8C3|nr:hypothetical protein [Actinomadura sp. NEAU-AAG7]MBT2212504.1 hypothetical protein [Actinomadura sp. NEAU-AAG7]